METTGSLKTVTELQAQEDKNKETDGATGRGDVQYQATQRLDVQNSPLLTLDHQG